MCFMLDESDTNQQFFMVGGLLFVKITKGMPSKKISIASYINGNTILEPWTIAYSKKNNREYWFNLSNGASTFEHPIAACAEFE
jgi:hypothetical protein